VSTETDRSPANAAPGGAQVYKARTVRKIDPVSAAIAEALKGVAPLRYVKLFPGRLTASNAISTEGRKNPVVTLGAEGIVGVELLVDAESRVVQFFAITSAVKGCGHRIVAAVVSATPADWHLAVVMDWSGGFWRRMAEQYPRLVIF
jgi:hypothetical protein